MIGLALLYWICSKIDGLVVGENAFYEDLPIDDDGGLVRYGVYCTTESAPVRTTSDKHQFITFYVAIGEGAEVNGVPVAEKLETDRLIDAIGDLVQDGLSYYDELCNLTIPETDITLHDVRLLPSNSKVRGGTLPNGAIIKSLVAEVYFKN